jgi:hypothetical protein
LFIKMRVGGSTRVRTVSFPECIGLDAVLAVGHRPTRNFGEPQKLSRGGSDRLVEVYQPFIGAALASDELVITRGVADYGNDFADRAVTAVRRFSNFTEDNDPYGEHDFGSFDLDAVKLFWKIDYYDRKLEYGSPDPADPAVTRRVLTILLAEEY